MSIGLVRSMTLPICAFALITAAAMARHASRMEVSRQGLSVANSLFEAGEFAQAANAYEAAVREQPRSAAALAGLARMRLYQHREEEAVELARKAITLAPGDSLATQVLHSADERRKAFAPNVFAAKGPSAGTADFVVTDPLPVVHVQVAGHQANFLIDTGAPDIAVSRALAATLQLPLTSSGFGTFAGGQQAKVEQTTVPDLDLASLHLSNLPAVVTPSDLQIPGLRIDGIIGTGLLMHFLATLDYCRSRLVLNPRERSAEFERSAVKARASIVPMWLVGDHFIFARAKMNGADGLFNIDTGLAGGGLVATKSLIDAAGIKLNTGKVLSGEGGGGRVRFIPFRASASLGNMSVMNVPGVYTPDGDPYRIFPFKVAGALSHSFFRHARLTLDFDRMALITERC